MEKIIEMKGHPVIDQILAFQGRKAFYDLVDLISEKSELTNKEIYDSVVFKALDAMIEDEEKTFHKTIDKGTELYRCRKIEKAKSIKEGGIEAGYSAPKKFFTKGYDEYNSKEAPLHKAAAARVNIQGASYLYLAEEPYTACAEVRPENHSYVSLAKFRINQDARIIDLKTNQQIAAFEEFEKEYDLSIASLFTEVMRFFAIPAVDKAIYLTTELIADHIRKAGFDGIKFQSSVSGGSNITLFNCHRSRVQFIDSHVIFVDSLKYNIIDIENEKMIIPPKQNEWDMKYTNSVRNELEHIIMQARTNNTI